MTEGPGKVVLRVDLIGALIWAAVLGALLVVAVFGVICLVAH
jgi:hypothetical protein